MKIATDDVEVTVVGGGASRQFGIKPSREAFQILSSGLYSDKILAIVRELSCNAYDSHVEAGCKDRPFDVQLPNGITPEFRIRDYGTGLDHDGVFNVFATYFESTKQSSNDYVGMMGLGSKSPFSYTETWTITAIKNGVKRIYSAVLVEGLPEIVKFGPDAKTTEENGVEIKFAVKRSDFYRFEDAARRVFRWFDVIPTITGTSITIERQAMKHTAIVPGVDIRESGGNLGNGPLVRQGNVVYPMRPDPEDIDKDLRELLNVPFVIDFPIGSLAVAASREELQYIAHTNTNINARLREVSTGLKAYIERELSGAKNDWDKLLTVRRMTDSVFAPIMKSIAQAESDKLLQHARFDVSYNRPHILIGQKEEQRGGYTISAYSTKSRNNSTGAVRLSKQSMNIRYENDDKGNRVPVDHRYEIEVRDSARFYINDTGKRNCLSRVRQDLTGATYQTVYVIQADTKKQIDAFVKDIGGAEIILCSTLEEPVRSTTRVSGTGQRIALLELSYEGQSRRRYHNEDLWVWTELTDTIKNVADGKQTLYVALKNRTVLKGQQELDRRAFASFMSLLKNSGIVDKDVRVIGVRKSALENLTKHYVDLFDFVVAELTKISTTVLEANVRRKALEGACPFNLQALRMLTKGLPADHAIVEVLQELEALKSSKPHEHPDRFVRLQQVASRVNFDFDIKDNEEVEEKGTEMWNAIVETYPMLKLARPSYNGDIDKEQAEALLGYFKLVDQAA